MIRIPEALLLLFLLTGCADWWGDLNRLQITNARILACWNDGKGYIRLTTQEPGGTVRQLTLDPDTTPPCNIWYTRNQWTIALHKSKYTEIWTVDGAK